MKRNPNFRVCGAEGNVTNIQVEGGISYIFWVPQAERIETQILGFLELRETKPTWCLGNGEGGGGGLIFGGFEAEGRETYIFLEVKLQDERNETRIWGSQS